MRTSGSKPLVHRGFVVLVALLAAGASTAWAQEEQDEAVEDEAVDIAPPGGLPAPPEAPEPPPPPKEEDLSDAMNVDTSFTLSPSKQGGGLSMGPGRPRTYEVVKGDTLWDISSRFWGDPYFWPTLWSYNPSIGNAHFIYPGDLLYFNLGSSVRPPGMGMEGPRGDAVAGVTPDGPALPPTASDAALSNTLVSNSLVCAPPKAFAEDGPGFRVKSNLTGFFKEDSYRPIGKLIRSPADHETFGPQDLVYLSFSRLSEVSCGDVYTLYHVQEARVHHPEHPLRKLGDIYEITGEVRIIDVNDRVATAEVIRAYNEIFRGELVAEFIPVRRDVQVRATTKDLEGTIIGAQRPVGDPLSTTDLVFVDRGDEDGLSDGDTFYIVRRGDGMYPSRRRDRGLPDHIIGRLVIVETGPSVSTALITEATDVLLVGDRISMQVF